jgi:hypothetical protein
VLFIPVSPGGAFLAGNCTEFFHFVFREVDVPYGGRMVPWLFLVASRAVLCARVVGTSMVSNIRKG